MGGDVRITGARWTYRVNLLFMLCDCGLRFSHRADRKRIICLCGKKENLMELRKKQYSTR
jgi:hypothetical protein